MIPVSHVLLFSVLQFTVGLTGILVRRSGEVAAVCALIMMNSIVLALGAVLVGPDESSAQAAGMVVLACMVSFALVGAAVLYSFHRFKRAVALDEHDRMRR